MTSSKVLAFFLRTKRKGIYVCCNSEGADTIVEHTSDIEAIKWFEKFAEERGQKPHLVNSLLEAKQICKENGVECNFRRKTAMIFPILADQKKEEVLSNGN